MNNSVIFKGNKQGIRIILDSEMDFAEIRSQLKEKLSSQPALKFFKGAKSAFIFSGRELSEQEENELIEIIKTESNVEINYIADDKLPVRVTEPEAQTQAPVQAQVDPNTVKFHYGSLRSGQEIQYDGSVVIIGDVNPGGQVIASGNVIVLGRALGLIHAGANGDRSRFAFAIDLAPTQLRIADLITQLPAKSKKGNNTLQAYIDDGKIFIAPVI